MDCQIYLCIIQAVSVRVNMANILNQVKIPTISRIFLFYYSPY